MVFYVFCIILGVVGVVCCIAGIVQIQKRGGGLPITCLIIVLAIIFFLFRILIGLEGTYLIAKFTDEVPIAQVAKKGEECFEAKIRLTYEKGSFGGAELIPNTTVKIPAPK